MNKTILTMILLTAATLAQAGTLYRWVDDRGRVHYTADPPPKDARQVEQKSLGGRSGASSNLPYATQQAMKKYPVTVYNTDCGEACNQARAYLQQRGIPYSEKDPKKNDADAEALKKLIGALDVPVLIVGKLPPLTGYQESAWAGLLDQADYPKTASRPARPAAKPVVKTPPPAEPPPATP